jgi:acyl-CoA synthetase (AMP-forming)/AMP-acid ligase II
MPEPDPEALENLLDLVEGAAAQYGDRPYMLPGDGRGRVYSFADVLTFTRGCADLFDELGVPPGARVATSLHNSSLAAMLFLGVIAAQRVLVPLNPKAGAAELVTLLDHCAPALLLGHGLQDAERGPVRLDVGDEEVFIADLLARGAARPGRLEPGPGGPARDAEIVYTSGSTGAPKGVVLSHRGLLANGLALALWGEVDEDDLFLNVVPMFHAGGHGFPTLTPLWRGARTVCVRSEAALARFWTYADRHRPTWTLVVNAFLAHLVGRPERPSGSRFKGFLAGGSALSSELIRRFEDTFGIPVFQVYGMTEMTSVTTVEPLGRKPGDRRTAGPPVPFARLRIVDPDGRDLGPYENGELLLRGPGVFNRYEAAPEQTAARLVDGWVHSGDLAHVDEAGELTIVDRMDSMVIVNGENVYPAEVESAALHLSGVRDSVVVALPHSITGVELVLVYTLAEGAEADPDGWRATLLQHLTFVKVPRRFAALGELGLEEFPRTPLGKIMRPEVRRLAVERLG